MLSDARCLENENEHMALGHSCIQCCDLLILFYSLLQMYKHRQNGCGDRKKN